MHAVELKLYRPGDVHDAHVCTNLQPATMSARQVGGTGRFGPQLWRGLRVCKMERTRGKRVYLRTYTFYGLKNLHTCRCDVDLGVCQITSSIDIS